MPWPWRLFGIDVECAATGEEHWDRAPCRCSVVTEDGKTVLDVHIAVPNLFSPLTEYTRMSAEAISRGFPLEQVRDLVRQHVGPRGALVGQSVQHDIEWLHLEEGSDYGTYFDIAEVLAKQLHLPPEPICGSG